ncbi:ribokinase [Paenibacillus macerans]|uniref:ribokinase n=1 Tax=Paenibacillus macerans TaxID=44252 RepID=UPI003D31FFFE
MGIMVIGSFMMDLVVGANRAPEGGETIIGNSFDRFPGGKGANQAVAAARLGGSVAMAGKLGDDPFGKEMRDVLLREGIDAGHVLTDAHAPTGVGSVVLDGNGQNRIIVVPGANLQFTPEETRRLEPMIRSAQMLVMQLEMDISVIELAAEFAAEYGVPCILNPAPARELSDELLRKVTYLTPNESELALLTGIPADSEENVRRGAQALVDRGVGTVIVTLAEKGALIAGQAGMKAVEGFPVKPVDTVDTVAAGDSFNGALAVELLRGASAEEAVRFANAVGALTVTRRGAIPSLPRRDEVEAFLRSRMH